MSRPSFWSITTADVALINGIIDELYGGGTIYRRRRDKAEGKVPRPGYDRSAVMRSGWAYRKGEGLSMSAALRRAWADARRANLRAVA